MYITDVKERTDRRDDARDALLELLRLLDARGYRFVTATPATHRRVVSRPGRREAADLRDLLGWSLPFAPATAPPEVLALLRRAGAVEEAGNGLLRATVRVSSVREALFLHSA